MKYLTIIGMIFLIGMISAIDVNLTAGETYQLELSEPYSYYLVEGNSTPIELEIVSVGNLVNITISKYTKSESFSITFYNQKDEPVSSGGGSSSYRQILPEPLDNYLNPDDYPRFFQDTLPIEVFISNGDEPEIEDLEEEKESWEKVIFWLFGIFITFLVILLIIFKIKENKSNSANRITS